MRKQTCLNGYWNFSCASHTLEQLPAQWEETKILVPSPYNINRFAQGYPRSIAGERFYVSGGDFRLFPEYPLHWDDAKCGFYRRSVFIPTESRGKRLFLRFDAVAFRSVFYLNGKKISEEIEAFLPIEIEITDHAVYGAENELLVGAEVASAMKYKDENQRNRLDYPQGSFWGDQVSGIWQDVWLCERPMEYVSDIFAVSDVSRRALQIRYEYAGGEGLEIKFSLSRWNPENTEGEPESERPVLAAPCDGSELTWQYDEGEIELWDIDRPALYLLRARLYREGVCVDETAVRIGFRSFTAEGGKFLLNGTPINLKNDSWHYMGYSIQTEAYARAYYRMAKDAFVNIIRLHAQPFPSFFYDIADEMGMLLVSESGIWASHCNFSYNPDFFENSKKHLRRLIRRDRNHPSVVMWSPENECIPAYKVCGSKFIRDVKDLEDKLYDLTQLIPPLDSSRLISCDGSGDLNGRLPVNSLHYPGYDCPTHREKPITIGEMGSMYYSTPDTVCGELGQAALESFDGRLEAVARDAFRNLTGQRKWASQVCVFNLIWYGLEPLAFPDQPLTYEDYTAPGIKPSRVTPYMRTLNAGADANLPDYIPNPVFKWTKEAYRPIRFFLENAPSSGYSGTEMAFPVTIFNDERGKADLKLDVKWVTDGVHAADMAEKTYTLPTAAFTEDVINIKMPAADGKGMLIFTLYKNGGIVFREEWPVALYDRQALQKEWEALGISQNQIVTPGSQDAPAYASFLKPGAQRRLFGIDGDICFNKPLDGFYFDDYLNFNAKPLYFNGSGNPAALSLADAGQDIVLCGLNLHDCPDEPQTLVLRNRLGRYIKDNAAQARRTAAAPAYFYGDADGTAAAMLNEINAEYEVIDHTTLLSLLNRKQNRLLIVDGKNDLGWLKGVGAGNFARVLVIGLAKAPDLFAYDFSVTDRKAFHLTGGRPARDLGLYGNNLYGLGSGGEEILASNLLQYDKPGPILVSLSPIDWRMWNHNAEYLKTVSILKGVTEGNALYAAISRHEYAGSEIYFSQVNCSTVSRKIKHITVRLLSSLGARVQLRENNELEELLLGGLYSNHVTGMLQRRLAEGEDIHNIRPGLNRVENGAVWVKAREGKNDTEGTLALFVYSPQDRTDLLLNPDTVDMYVKAQKNTRVYLNGEFQTEGTDFTLTSVIFKAGWNLLVLHAESQALPDIRFKRINLKPLDLKFGLYDSELTPQNMQKAVLSSQDQPNGLENAAAGREKHWRSSTDQHDGVDLCAAFPAAIQAKALYFNASTSSGRECFPPYRFKILAGDTPDTLKEIYFSQFEPKMYYPGGKVFLRLDDVTAKLFKIVLTDNALKPWIVSNLIFLS